MQYVGNVTSNTGFKGFSGLNSDVAFVNMDDDQLRYIAYNLDNQNHRRNKKNEKSILNTFLAIPIVDTFASGILTSRFMQNEGFEGFFRNLIGHTPLSERATVMAHRAGFWALAGAGMLAYNGLKKAFVKKPGPARDFAQNHPLGTMITDIGVFVGGFFLAVMGLRKGKEAMAGKFPEFFSHLSAMKHNIIEALDNSKINQRFVPFVEKMAEEATEKAPRLMGAAKFALANSVFILLGLGIYKVLSYDHKRVQHVDNTVSALRQLQLAKAKQLVNQLGVERDVLAQDRPGFARDLRQSMSPSSDIY